MQLIYVDESKFNSTKLGRQRKLGPRGTERVIINRRPNEARTNMLLMTTLAHEDDPLFFALRDPSVNADVFVHFIEEAVRYGRVPRDSIVVWDNARIHVCNATIGQLDAALRSVGATWANLPAYAPEFNACELVFAEVKTYMRSHARPRWTLRSRIQEAAGHVSYGNLLSYYQHCTEVALRVAKQYE